MSNPASRFERHLDFVLIGDPVAHSLSPIMHNKLYEELAEEKWPFKLWRYSAVQCVDKESAAYQVSLVRTGKYRGMNITMPWKKLALELADYADASADAAGGANVLVRKEDLKLYAYNTDGRGAVGAIERVGETTVTGKRALICGTGPTSSAIACALAEAGASEIALVSRKVEKACTSIERMAMSMEPGAASKLRGMNYTQAENLIGAMDIIVDATPCGMKPGDPAVIDTSLLHEGQIVLDTVYAHGSTAIVEGARAQGALAMDGLEMLVEQAALSVEIWADAVALPVHANREIMRRAALEVG